MTRVHRASTARLSLFSVCIALIATPFAVATGQTVSITHPLTLAEAWSKAEARNDQLIIADARSAQARGDALQAGSTRRPQLAAYTAYDRTLRSEFDGISGFAADSAASTDEGSAEIPFGSAHAYRAGLTASYVVLSGGRSTAQTRAAASARRAAAIGITMTRAQVRLDIAEAYYDAQLAEQMYRIAQWTVDQAESTYQHVVLLSNAGRAPDFDVVRARAARDRQAPAVIQRRSDRDIALLRLRQLLDWPSSAPLILPTDVVPPAPVLVEGGTQAGSAKRAAVREAEELVARQEQRLQAVQADRLPSLSLTSRYERVAYPLNGKPSWGGSRANWTVGARVDLPILSGGRQQGGDAIARAELDAARARLRLTQRTTELNAEAAIARLRTAEAVMAASDGSTEEAARAYAIAELRYREGVSIQLELSDARLLLEQARADRARAARDVAVERVRATLLSDLPLDSNAIAAAGTPGSRVVTP